jgi:Tfp pilus assembly protein PilX
MANLCQAPRKIAKQAGVALVIIMLLLAALTVVAMNMLTLSNLETKMGASQLDYLQGTTTAMGKLKQYEQEVAANKTVPNAEIISTSICGVTMYRITAQVRHYSTKVIIQSTFAKVGDIAHCDPIPRITAGRQSWQLKKN